jgi:hypothetical protein
LRVRVAKTIYGVKVVGMVSLVTMNVVMVEVARGRL